MGTRGRGAGGVGGSGSVSGPGYGIGVVVFVVFSVYFSDVRSMVIDRVCIEAELKREKSNVQLLPTNVKWSIARFESFLLSCHAARLD